MGHCCVKVENWMKGTEVPVPEGSAQKEQKSKVPARKSTKLVKLKAFKDSTIKDIDIISTESYLKSKSLLKQSHLNSESHKHHMNDKLYEVKEVSIRSTSNSFSTNNYQGEESSQFQLLSDDEIIVILLKSHFLFQNINDSQYTYILEEMLEYQIEANVSIFKRGEQGTGMFLIKSGQVELTTASSKASKKHINEYNRLILQAGDTFGELSLVIDNSRRNYSAFSLTPMHFYLIDSNSYQLISSQNGFYYTKQYNGHKTPQIAYLNKNPFFSSLQLNYKEDLTHLSYLKKTNKDQEFNDSDNLYVLIEGNCICDVENNKIIAEEGAFLGLENVFYFESKEKRAKVITSISPCVFIALPLKALYEVLGINYKYFLCFQLFKSIIMSNEILRSFINETQAISLFNEFKLHSYETGNVIYSKVHSKANSKVIMVFDGEIAYESNSTMPLVKIGNQFGANMLNEDNCLADNIISKGSSLLFECPWDKIREIAKSTNPHLMKQLNRLRSIDILRGLSETKLIDISNRIVSFSFLKEEVIISPKIPCEHLYFLIKGEVRARINTKTIHRYSSGDSFGEVYLLNKHEFKSSIVASSNTVKTYSIPKEYFFELIKDKQIESEVNRKMQLEDKKIKLNDLYFINDIHKGKYGSLSLVHNKKSLYAIRSINKGMIDKSKQDIHYLLNQKSTMEELSHPFICKLVKTMKTPTWCFEVIEYTAGVLLSDHIGGKIKKEKRVEYARFYGAIMHQIAKYIHKKDFLHRDIKLSSFIIDRKGYLKLINVKTAKKLFVNNIASTVIGTPHYMAPEVINGKDYSFACDYWSIGVCLYYIYYKFFPFGNESNDPIEIYKDIISDKAFKLKTDSHSGSLNSLLELLLDKDQNIRTRNVNEIEFHSLFSDLNWERLLSKQLDSPWIATSFELGDENLLKRTDSSYVAYLDSVNFVENKDEKERLKGSGSNYKFYNRNWFEEF